MFSNISTLSEFFYIYNKSANQREIAKYCLEHPDELKKLVNVRPTLTVNQTKILGQCYYKFSHYPIISSRAYIYLVKKDKIPLDTVLKICTSLSQFKLLIRHRNLNIFYLKEDFHSKAKYSLYSYPLSEDIVRYLYENGLDIYQYFADLLYSGNVKYFLDILEVDKMSEENLKGYFLYLEEADSNRKENSEFLRKILEKKNYYQPHYLKIILEMYHQTEEEATRNFYVEYVRKNLTIENLEKIIFEKEEEGFLRKIIEKKN